MKTEEKLTIKKIGIGQYIISSKPIPKRSLFERFYDFMSRNIFGGQKTIFIILISLGFNFCHSQQNLGSLTAGNKAFEISFIHENEEGLGFGLATSLVHSGLVESRANKNDSAKNIHEFTNKVTPAVFGLISGNFEELTIIGKLGTAYINQRINSIQDSKKYYLAIGISFEVPITEEINIKASYDNVNSVLAGVSFKI